MDVTLLGTGTPRPLADRFGASTLVEAGADKLLFDCGRGCSIRLFQKGVTLRDVKLFLTHLHFDHTVGIPDLWLTGWLPTLHIGDLSNKPLFVAGPEGTTSMMEHLREAYAADIAVRAAQEHMPAPRFEAREIAPGVVYEAAGVKVSAFEVDHGAHMKPAYGYRVDYLGRSVLISGDTRFNENVIKYGAGVDVLIHEVAMIKSDTIAQAMWSREILTVHTLPQDAGRVFAATKPRLAVYTHFGVAGRSGSAAATPADFEAATRETYAGPLVLGEDLMTIHIGEAITVERPAKK
jgi:ribonuclease Z